MPSVPNCLLFHGLLKRNNRRKNAAARSAAVEPVPTSPPITTEPDDVHLEEEFEHSIPDGEDGMELSWFFLS